MKVSLLGSSGKMGKSMIELAIMTQVFNCKRTSAPDSKYLAKMLAKNTLTKDLV